MTHFNSLAQGDVKYSPKKDMDDMNGIWKKETHDLPLLCIRTPVDKGTHSLIPRSSPRHTSCEACIYVTPECRRYFSAHNTHRLSVTEHNPSVGCSDDFSSAAILGTLDVDPLACHHEAYAACLQASSNLNCIELRLFASLQV